MRQLLLNLLPDPIPTRENFVSGPNGEALAALGYWLECSEPDTGFYLWGAGGSGKTHLLRASGLDYFDGAEDPNLDTLALPESDLPHLPADGIAVDNVHRLGESGQHQLFNAFNRLRADGKRLLTAGPVAPQFISLREDLRNRLGYGLVYSLKPLSDTEKFEALALMASERQLIPSNDIIPYLIRHTPRDMGSLTTLLLALDYYSLEQQRPITLPLLREVLQSSLEFSELET